MVVGRLLGDADGGTEGRTVGITVGKAEGELEGLGVGRNGVGLLDVGCEVGAWSARSIERVGFGVGLRVDGFDVGMRVDGFDVGLRVNSLSTVGI